MSNLGDVQEFNRSRETSMTIKLPALIAAAAFLLGSPSFAQTSSPLPHSGAAQPNAGPPGAARPGSVGSTRTGELPEKTGSTTAVGQTKPPGGALGDGLGTRPDLEEKSRDIDRNINKGICNGC